MNPKQTKSVYEIVTDQILDLLKAGVIPWKMPWRTGVPQNLVSKRPYEGINAIMLAITADMKGYSSPYWLTMKQCDALGGRVRKGEKSTIVTFWKKIDRDTKKETDASDRESTFFILRYHRVWNLDQTDGIERTEPAVTQPVGKIEACEYIVSSYVDAPPIEWGGDRAFYDPKRDRVGMPDRSRFHSTEGCYAALFHELGHSTGHATRLNRPEIVNEQHRFGSDDYSREELVAEFTAAFLCGVSGIAPSIVKNAAAYIHNWSERLKENSKLVIEAAGKAQKAANYIQGLRPVPPPSYGDSERTDRVAVVSVVRPRKKNDRRRDLAVI